MRGQEKALREAMVSIVREAMPKVSAVLDPLRQMNQHVADLRTGAGTDRGDFLTLATRFGTVAEPDSVQSIEFGAGQFKLRFRSPAEKSSEARNRLVESAAQAGIDLVFESDSVRLTRRKRRDRCPAELVAWPGSARTNAGQRGQCGGGDRRVLCGCGGAGVAHPGATGK